MNPVTKSWQSSLMGALTAVFLLIGPHLKDNSKPWIDSGNILAAVSAAGLGAVSQDHKSKS